MHVTLTVWRIPARRLPEVGWRLARDRGRLRRAPGVRFAKLLGTSRGFTSADLTRWAALVVADGPDRPAALDQWRRLASAECRLTLRPIASHGRWSGRQPFAPVSPGNPADGQDGPAGGPGTPSDGPLLALTRARLRPARAARFWQAIGPVAAYAADSPGRLAAFGIGEAPIGWQGTVSLWRSSADLVEFAYRHPAHRRVIEQTTTVGWYAEDLYARFAVEGVDGDPEVIGWTERSAA